MDKKIVKEKSLDNKLLFEDKFGLNLLDLHRDLEDYLDINAFDLLNNLSKNNYTQFIELIFENVKFEYNKDYEEESDESESEFILDEDFYEEK